MADANDPTLADKLRTLAEAAGENEDAVREALGVLHAVTTTDMLASLPQGADARADHNAAYSMLLLLARRLRQVTKEHAETGIKLRNLADELAEGR